MELMAVLAIAALYLYGAGRVIRWGATKSEQKPPSWWDAIGVVLLPSLLARGTKWIIPDAWGWPETAIAAVLGAVVFYLILRCVFHLRTGYAALTLVTIYGLALLMMLKMLPYILKKNDAPSRPSPAVVVPRGTIEPSSSDR